MFDNSASSPSGNPPIFKTVFPAVHELVCRACGNTITTYTEILRLAGSQDFAGIEPSFRVRTPQSADYSYEMNVMGTNTTINVFTNPASERGVR